MLIVALAVNAIVLGRQTEGATITAPGATLIPTADGTMQVLVQGNPAGSPILEVHGVEASLHWFDRITPLFARTHLVIRVDLIGNGGSAKPGPGHYRIADQARAVGNVLASLHIRHVTAVGHSMGGQVVTALAEQNPAAVSRIVVLDTGASAAARSLGPAATLSTTPVIGPGIKTLLEVAGNLLPDPAAVAFAPGFDVAKGFPNPDQPRDDINATTYTAFAEEQAAAPPYVTAKPLDQRLAALGKPVLVIFGTRDQIAVGERHTLALYRTVPGAIVRTIPGVGHSPQVEAPLQTASLILAFIGANRSSTLSRRRRVGAGPPRDRRGLGEAQSRRPARHRRLHAPPPRADPPLLR
ncbi:MAG: alpha/beta hydrolase fold protein [Actinomycetia bacterium]|nr:alpha/beta hydrolase fold protein [Actinomycetes bacterium]